MIALLMVAYCLPAAYVTVWPDTVRDLASSLLLARGEKIPLTGPGPINFGPYAGPAWIFLQAPPLLFSASFTATSVYVAFVASLKFPALFELGRRLSGPRLGLCMAVAAAIPSFAVYQWILFFHINWVEVMVTATLILFLLADWRRSLAMAYAAILMLGLAVQIHTTTLFYFPLAALVLYRIGVPVRRIPLHLVAMVILVLLWFTPVLFAPPAERGTLGGATTRIASDVAHFHFATIPTALRTAFIDYPISIGRTFGTAAHIPQWAWNAGVGAVWLAIAAGALLRLTTRQGRGLFLGTVGALVAAWTVGVAVRSFTSFYLLYFLLPLAAVAFGLSLESLLASRALALRVAGSAALALIAVSLGASAYGARAIGRSGIIDTHLLAIGDLAHPQDISVRGTLVGAAARDALAIEACAIPASTVTLHGELAYALSISLGLDYRMHCPRSADRFLVFGKAQGVHLAALPESVVPLLGIAQDKPATGVRLLPFARPIYPEQGHPFAKGFSYFERLPDAERQPMQRVLVEFDAKPHELVLVYRHKPFASAWSQYQVMQDGAPARPAFTTFDSWIYRAGDTGGHWTVSVETDAPQWVEVFALPTGV